MPPVQYLLSRHHDDQRRLHRSCCCACRCSAGAAERATVAVLAGMGGHLTTAHREIVANELPPALGAALLDAEDLAVPLLRHVLAPGMSVGHARELIASVCRVLVEELSGNAVRTLRTHVPSIATYLAEPAPETTPTRARSESLAAGRPGSRHPISESAGSRSHVESVGVPNPHGATKLSSSTGSTQERHIHACARSRARIIEIDGIVIKLDDLADRARSRTARSIVSPPRASASSQRRSVPRSPRTSRQTATARSSRSPRTRPLITRARVRPAAR